MSDWQKNIVFFLLEMSPPGQQNDSQWNKSFLDEYSYFLPSAFSQDICNGTKAELLQLYHTQFSSLGIFISKKVGNRKN